MIKVKTTQNRFYLYHVYSGVLSVFERPLKGRSTASRLPYVRNVHTDSRTSVNDGCSNNSERLQNHVGYTELLVVLADSQQCGHIAFWYSIGQGEGVCD